MKAGPDRRILEKATAYFARGVALKYAWIEKHRDSYSATMM
jgi:hypothetical protein